MVAELSNVAGFCDGFEKAVIEIGRSKESISVPELSRLLGVKTTTINARFRREGIQPVMVGRTNYISGNVALSLAEMHRYALLGWPTLHEVSRQTGIKSGTLKARCEKGKLEGHVDLTRRLRINPVEVPHLQLLRQGGEGKANEVQPRRELKLNGANGHSRGPSLVKPAKAISRVSAALAPAHNPFTLPPAPEPRVQIITARDYGLPARNAPVAPANTARPGPNRPPRRTADELDYIPEKPFSISQCSVGKSVVYEKHLGTILKLIPDPFSPAIKVAFPEHDEPLMREILLRVAR